MGSRCTACLRACHCAMRHQSRLLGTLKPHRWWLPVRACAARSFFSLLAGSSIVFSFVSRTMACTSKRYQQSATSSMPAEGLKTCFSV